MDGRTRYNKIVKLLSEHQGKTMHMDDLRKMILIDIGTSDEVIRDSLRLMIDLGMIVERKHMVFEVME